MGPIPEIHGVVRWRLDDLVRWTEERWGITMSRAAMGRTLKRMGYSVMTVRPRHRAQDPAALEKFKKKFPEMVEAIRAALPPGTTIEIWWQDEARVGQKNSLTRVWARRGARPRVLKDQRTASVYLFGAICPERGVAAGLVMPYCDTHAMQMHLEEISAQVSPGAHAVLILDRAGWHVTARLRIPADITIEPLPAGAPELNPVENVWQYMRGAWLSNRVFESHDELVDKVCQAWMKLRASPETIRSIGRRDWHAG